MIVHESRNRAFRRPFGAAETGTEVYLAAEKAGARLFVPPLRLCGDNAAMIGCQGYYEFLAGHTAGPELNAYATMPLEKQIG